MARRMPALHASLLAWYARERRDLPWRKTRDPYAIWLSEIMLQQTRVQTVIPYYARFLGKYPTVQALAEAPLDGVLTLWSGLGYYRRARMLHEGARAVVAEHHGKFPPTADGLRAIRGIGRYTAGAIASIAFGEPAPLVDGNVARVLARIFAVEDDVRGGRGLARIWTLAEALVPSAAGRPDGSAVGNPGDWNQALMELGATLCVPKNPGCLLCPVREQCEAKRRGIEAELPRLAAKAKPAVVRRVALVALGPRAGKVLLGKRRPGGLFAGLWEPPLLDAAMSDSASRAPTAALTRRFEALTGARLGALSRAGEIVHVLSHRRLEIEVFCASLGAATGRSVALAEGATEYESFERVAPSELGDRGLSSLARKVLAAAKVT